MCKPAWHTRHAAFRVVCERDIRHDGLFAIPKFAAGCFERQLCRPILPPYTPCDPLKTPQLSFWQRGAEWASPRVGVSASTSLCSARMNECRRVPMIIAHAVLLVACSRGVSLFYDYMRTFPFRMVQQLGVLGRLAWRLGLRSARHGSLPEHPQNVQSARHRLSTIYLQQMLRNLRAATKSGCLLEVTTP